MIAADFLNRSQYIRSLNNKMYFTYSEINITPYIYKFFMTFGRSTLKHPIYSI